MPERTCVTCQDGAERDDLVRLVVDPEGRLVVDYRARLPGRGAWVHPRKECVAAVAKQPGRLARALHVDAVDSASLEADLNGAVLRALGDGLSLAAAGGALIAGFEVLSQALAAGDVSEVALASDAALRTERELRRAAREGVGFTVVPFDRDALGARVGKAPLAAIGVLPGGATVHLRRQLRRLRDLG